MTTDGGGGVIMVWEDRRIPTDPNLFAQRVNASGVTQWNSDGNSVSSFTGLQSFQAITADGSGGAVFAWHDERAGTMDYDIYAQRMNGSGVAQWTTDGEPICIQPGVQTIPSLVADGNGNFVVLWSD